MKSTVHRSPTIRIFESRGEMGAAAARRFQERLEELAAAKRRSRVIFGCAPSQDEFFQALVTEARGNPEPWRLAEVFHMDEYVGVRESHPQSFRCYLRSHFLDQVETARFHPIRGDADSAAAEAQRYAGLLAAGPIDLIALGIGENGHVAFNDPAVADFSDPVLAKVVELDDACRRQQVNDGCFPTVSEVPRLALTITLPVFAQAGSLLCTVPGLRKAAAVRNAVMGPIGPECPATVLRTHPRAELFLDRAASSLLPDSGG